MSEVAQDPLIGTVLEGRYRIDALLGRGGMGSVYLAEELRLRRRCALKVLRAELAADHAYVERFLREAQTIAQLAHEHIVDIHSFGQDDTGAVFFVMELLEGEDLEARLRDRPHRPVHWRDVCEWGVQIARAVGAVHDAGLIHRDLKPGNVFLARRRDGSVRVKLLDFGIVRPEDGSELTSTGATLGTPHYMSPEQIRTLPMDRRSDIYSFGVLLYKALTGRFVFRGEPIQVAMMHVEAAPSPPSSVSHLLAVPPALDAIVLRCLGKLPADRYQSMAEVLQALHDLLASADAADDDLTSTAPAASRSRPPIPATPPPASAPLDPDPSTSARGSAPGRTFGEPGSAGDVDVPATLMSRRTDRPAARGLIVTAALVLTTGVLAYTLTRPAPTTLASIAHDPTPAVEPSAPATNPANAPPATPTDPADVPATTSANASPAAPTNPADASPTNPADVTPTASRSPGGAPRPPASDPVPPNAGKRTSKPEPTKEIDPLKLIARKAQACRREHDAVGGPPIVVDYAIDSTGKITRSVPKEAGPLGKCLADAVKQTTFPPKLALGQKIDL